MPLYPVEAFEEQQEGDEQGMGSKRHPVIGQAEEKAVVSRKGLQYR